jgi:hypothetical protein
MSIWLKKHFGDSNFQQEFDRFEKLFTVSKNQRNMMMVESPGELGDTDLYIMIPNIDLSVIFPGFHVVPVTALPAGPNIVIADDAVYRSYFNIEN